MGMEAIVEYLQLSMTRTHREEDETTRIRVAIANQENISDRVATSHVFYLALL